LRTFHPAAAPIMEHSTDPIALWHRAQQIDEFS
jgi:hypothetical protein